ncbi:hypothetical protein NDU88_001918 [Pleurodeles waltl]|uniref:Uncharacterized protein n=1 Tax=Pleurodeles waltl TaxID=8319 RepID=A0AAV7WJX1_PLEWA|nr:hypothetical protein NDU88_001918 [Pleurodeles waltl]
MRRRTLVRGSAEVRRTHSLLRLRTRLPSLGSRNAPPEAPSLHQPGGHTGAVKSGAVRLTGKERRRTARMRIHCR